MQKILLHGTPILITIPLSRAHIALAYRNELAALAYKLEGWWNPAIDHQLFRTWGVLYQEIAKQCQPSFDPHELTGTDRHHFFIATEPVNFGQFWSPGLSLLDRILGYSYPDEKTQPPNPNQPPPITSGNAILDLTTDLCLVFKQSAPWIIENYGVEEARLILVQGNDRLRGEEAVQERARKFDLDRVGTGVGKGGAEDPLMASLAQFGISVPGRNAPPPETGQ